MNWLAIHLFGRCLLPILMRSWRLRLEIAEELLVRALQPEKVVLTFWHNRQIGVLAIANMLKPVKVLISRHGDGEIIAEIVSRFGVGAVRGSSTQGAVKALRQLVNETHSCHIAITPDGPVGPRYRIKKGVVAVAALTDRPIYWLCFAADRAWVFDSWDRFILPKPFAQLRFRAGGPIKLNRSMGEAELDEALSELEIEMRDQAALLDDQEGHPPDPALRE